MQDRFDIMDLRSLAFVFIFIAVLEWFKPVAFAAQYVCDPSKFESLGLNMSDLPYCDPSLEFRERAKDLVSRMSLTEKVRQMGNTASGVPRLGVNKYEWWSEILHGVSNTGPGVVFNGIVPGATSFPLPILSSASFNESLWRTMGEVASTEARAMHNIGKAGLTYWSPNINVLRDPRWGRAQETPGEDPLVVSRYAVNYVRGLQDTGSNSSNLLKTAACCKHYTAYDLDDWKNITRFEFDAEVTQQDMMDTFQPPFEKCIVEGNGASAMCSFNKINGIPTCADPKLLNATIRGEWNLNGYIVSDCDSIQVLFEHQHYVQTPEEAVAIVLRSGLELDCGTYYTDYLGNAVLQGKVKESDIDGALVSTYTTLMRLGFFDGNKQYDNLGANQICSRENQDLAIEAAKQGIVLLKNDGSLPLSYKKIKTLAVIGPNANGSTVMIGNYAGIPCGYTTPLQGLAKYTRVEYRAGCDGVACNDSRFISSAMKVAKKADAVVLVMGLNLTLEAEGHDRDDLLLPGYQMKLVSRVAHVSKGPVILAIMTGSAIDVSFAKKSDKISGILWVGYPGQGGGDAIAQVIFGASNPSGRLPMTWYPNEYVQNINYTDMHMRANPSIEYPGRTYRFYSGETVYPFGYGLSYGNFTYSIISPRPGSVVKVNLAKNQQCHPPTVDVSATNCPAIRLENEYSQKVCEDLNIEMKIEVKNNGKMGGSDVVLLYAVPPPGLSGAPLKQLIAFERVFVASGESSSIVMKVNLCDSLGLVENAGYLILPAGQHTLMVGDSTSIPFVISLIPSP